MALRTDRLGECFPVEPRGNIAERSPLQFISFGMSFFLFFVYELLEFMLSDGIVRARRAVEIRWVMTVLIRGLVVTGTDGESRRVSVYTALTFLYAVWKIFGGCETRFRLERRSRLFYINAVAVSVLEVGPERFWLEEAEWRFSFCRGWPICQRVARWWKKMRSNQWRFQARTVEYFDASIWKSEIFL